jgi:ABC-type transporter Mla maintaining outer membrane lipid asymmetry ATPase subunit MlaF
MSDSVLEITNLRKDYGALRPLRLQALRVPERGIVALLGLDAAAAEMLTNLVTAATLPDEGVVHVFGQSTTLVTDADEWLRGLDRFGIFTDRAVLLEDLTMMQNLAMTLTLDIDPLEPEVRQQVETLACDSGIAAADLARKVATIDALARARVRLARALALQPMILLMEHPSASLAPADVPAFARDVQRIVRARAVATLAVTADAGFASAITDDVLKLVPATGALVAAAGPLGRLLRLWSR